MKSNKVKEYEDFLNEKHALFAKLLPLDSENNWKLETQKDSFIVYSKKDDESGLKYVRAEIDINASPEAIINMIKDVENFPKWDKTVEKVELVEKTDDYFITYNLTAPPGVFISKRDFISLASVREEPDGTLIWGSGSYNLESHPPVKGVVRADVHIYGVKVVPYPDNKNKSHVYTLLLIDIKGNIPKMLLNALCAEQAASLKIIKDVIEGKKKIKK